MARQAQITRLLLAGIAALEKSGHDVKAVRISASGEMTILTEAGSAEAANDIVDLAALAGKTEITHG